MSYIKTYISIAQKLNAGNNFSGDSPDKSANSDPGSFPVYDNLDTGGLFNFLNNTGTLSIREVRLKLADANDWSLEIDDPDTGNSWVIYERSDFSNTNDPNSVFITSTHLAHIRYRDQLKLYTSGASQAMNAVIVAGRWK